ncbi:hypothetical protein SODALDRAFT_318732 [Sodiomyces alkalinus F11]|uniref:Uncharacterized protein n=1 Tax=Sodiomyces alkalinus (strain CBS 110278 / VKM F-3762 / F11) TaxID=1314773 RepID=A0A3N2Q5K6_SODAK|nr:hypothetical protein SODALDRAFT_318732 [Sodiomyces alkalinus F11]ROT41938.1 hypothetical protein SODALDRAFT_318732 [Sodiomyces alkalinus F11]
MNDKAMSQSYGEAQVASGHRTSPHRFVREYAPHTDYDASSRYLRRGQLGMRKTHPCTLDTVAPPYSIQWGHASDFLRRGLSKGTRCQHLHLRTSQPPPRRSNPNIPKTIVTTPTMKSASVIAPATRREPIPTRPERSSLISLIEPAFSPILRYQYVFGQATCLLVMQAYTLAVLGILVSKDVLLVVRDVAAYNLGLVVRNIVYLGCRALVSVGKTRFARRLRRRLEFEIGLTILGPMANGIFLFVLWPGWWVLAAAALVGKILVG